MRRANELGYSYEHVRANDKLLIVYPQAGSAFYETLGRRLVTSCEEKSRDATLCSAAEVCELEDGSLDDTVVAVIAPAQCRHGLPDRDKFFRTISGARGRIMVLAESVETEWFENQFKVPLDFDALIDLGFVFQQEKLKGFETPYHFLFNAPTREERQTIERASVTGRRIPWATVGHERRDRVQLAHDLLTGFDPSGFVFLPPAGVMIKKENGMIGPEGLHALLTKTEYYVWESLHEYDYYESFRFREALLAGAMPCKVDRRKDWRSTGIPGIFPSVEAFAESAQREGFETILDSAKEFYFSQGLLADRLEEVLESV